MAEGGFDIENPEDDFSKKYETDIDDEDMDKE